MITYFYWAVAFSVCAVIFFGVGVKAKKWKIGLALSVIVLAIAWGAYAFHFQQIFVKRYGGVMAIQVPKGQFHPKTNTCIFSEYSKGNVLEGKVIVKNCNPLSR